MNPFSLIVVFTILWWLVFFIVLPIGIQPDEARDGNIAGVPKNPRIGKKVLITTLITLALTMADYYAVKYGFIDRFGVHYMQEERGQ